MKRWIVVIALGVLTSSLVVPGFGQGGPGGRGISTLLCLAEEIGFEIGNGHVSVEVDDHGVVDGIGEAEVTITHGNSSSTHTVVYADANESEDLDCGDAILSVT